MVQVGKELEYFALVTGLSAEEALPWLPLCSSCRQRLQAALRPGIVWEQEERLAFACGAIAAGIYQKKVGQQWKNVRLGDVSVQAASPREVGQIEQEARAMVEDLLDTAAVQLLGV